MEATTVTPNEASTGSKTIADLMALAARKHADKVALKFKRDGEWQDVTYAEVGEIVREIGLGLVDLGIEPGERVCILCNTRPEWTYADFAISAAGAVVVPIYPTNSPEECEWVAGNSEAVAVIAEDASQVAKIVAVRDRLPELTPHRGHRPRRRRGRRHLAGRSPRARARRRRGRARPADGRRQAGGPVHLHLHVGHDRPAEGLRPHARQLPLGARHVRVARRGRGGRGRLPLPAARPRVRAAHPAPVVRRRLDRRLLRRRHRSRSSPSCTEVKPTYLPSVPRIFEKIYTLATSSLSDEDHAQMEQAVKLGVKVRDLQARGEDVPEELRRPVRAGRREALQERARDLRRPRAPGGHRRGADRPRDPRVLLRLRRAGARGLRDDRDGDGRDATRRSRTTSSAPSGRALPGVEIRIADDGEVLIKGANIFAGYYSNDDASFGAIEDGWLHTGDLGSLDEDGYLSITGRKKDIIITAGGKNLTPANIENDMKQSRWISQAVMHGDRRPFPVMLVTLDEEEIVPWAEEQGLPRGHRRARKDEQVHGPGPGRARQGQREVRAGRAGQEVRDPRPRPVPGDRRADADAQGQAQRRQREVRAALRLALRSDRLRVDASVSRDEDRPHRYRRPLRRAPSRHAPDSLSRAAAARHAPAPRARRVHRRAAAARRWC